MAGKCSAATRDRGKDMGGETADIPIRAAEGEKD